MSGCVCSVRNGHNSAAGFQLINLMVLNECEEALKCQSVYSRLIGCLRASQHFHSVRLLGITTRIIAELDEDPDALESKVNQLEQVLACKGRCSDCWYENCWWIGCIYCPLMYYSRDDDRPEHTRRPRRSARRGS